MIFSLRRLRLQGVFIASCAMSFAVMAADVTLVPDRSFYYYLIKESIQIESSGTVSFRVQGVPYDSRAETYVKSFEARSGANCAERKRIDYYLRTHWTGREPIVVAADNDQMRSVYDDTRQAYELEVVCELAGQPTKKTWTGAIPLAPQRVAQGGVESGKRAAELKPAPPASRQLKSTGTGFFVASDGIVATNHHVAKDCGSLELRVNDRWLQAKTYATDEAADLALLKVDGGPYQTLSLSTVQPELGASVVVLGFPLTNVLGSDLRVTTGIVSSIGGLNGDRRNLQISAPVQPGNSGGPVLDDRGTVIGVAVARLAQRFNAENVNFAVKASLLRSLLEINGLTVSIGVPVKASSVADVVRRATSATVLIACF